MSAELLSTRRADRGAAVAVVAVIALGACFRALPKPSELTPITVTVRRTPREIVRITAQLLAREQFQITSADSARGTLVATRTKAITEQGGEIACDFSHPSTKADGATATMTIAIRTNALRDGTQLVITSLVRSPSVPQARGDVRSRSVDDCVSTGAVEQRIISALNPVPPPPS